ncbi:MAG: Type 1 glutamine amidotransferase-like domain-containing protein [Candidatus Pacebacteria bacterium]|nr:Type 1 glutamine amidotransferase-like domain-containing protein [Candidatus Paceibacterota bacterium]
MYKIIAIGGGEIGRPGFSIETEEIDKEIIGLAGKKRPRLLFVPTASLDSALYIEVVRKYFGEKLGCEMDNLLLIKGGLTKKEIKDKIDRADIIYVGGGDTLSMMKIWRKNGVDELLVDAVQKGKIMAGLSAGSICWFKNGLSDSLRFTSGKDELIKVSGLGVIKALHCPHYDVEKNRKKALREMMDRTSGVAIAIDNCAALEIVDDKYRIISSKSSAKAYKIFWSKGEFFEEEIKKEDFKPLADLLRK